MKKRGVFKRFIAILLVLLSMPFLLASDVVFASMETEARPFNIGNQLSGALTGGESDYYTVKLNSKGKLTLDFTYTAHNRYSLLLIYNTSGEEIGNHYFSSNDSYDNVKGVYTSKISETLSAGVYYIRVYSNAEEFDYSCYTAFKKSNTVTNTVLRLGLNLKKGTSTSMYSVVSGKTGTVTWKSSNTKIATVSKKGNIKAKNKGSAKITAKCRNKTVTIYVNVE